VIRIAHIVNPVRVSPSSDLYAAQPVTFASMQAAKAYAKEDAEVLLACTCYPEDRPIVPPGFLVTPLLTRSIMDVRSFAHERKFPVLKDILDRLYECSEGYDYLIYTNVDIGLQPYFYAVLVRLIRDGYDSLVINRRTVSTEYNSAEALPLIYAQAGEPHCGFDCFVFPREHYPEFFLGEACIGINWIGRVMLTNLLCTARKFKVLEDSHLTFHVGDDRPGKRPEYADYELFNNEQVGRALAHFEAAKGLPDHDLIRRFSTDVPRKRKKYERMLQGDTEDGSANPAPPPPSVLRRGLRRIKAALRRRE
jgi:hypothetical protein